MLGKLARDRVGIQKAGGDIWTDVPAAVQPGLIIFPSASIPLEEGDVITRQLPSGLEERFVVEDRGYHAGVVGIPAHYQAKVRRLPAAHPPDPAPATADNRSVFVVHGKDLTARDGLFEFLRAIGLKPLEWSQAVDLTEKAAPSISEVLEHAFGEAAAVVVLLTGDDEAYLAPRLRSPGEPEHEFTLTPQPRANVLFEAGMAFGIHQERTVLVQLGDIRPFSDIAGRYVIRLTNDTKKRQEVAHRLRAAGCPVDLSGTDWHSAGHFTAAKPSSPTSSPPTTVPAVLPNDDDALGILPLATTVEVADPERLHASGLASHVFKKSSQFWQITWKVDVFNKTRGNATYRIRLDFADAAGFVLDHTIEQPQALTAPNQQKTLSGMYRLDAEVAPRVKQVTANVSLLDLK
ncbi:MAG TPA: TIR domain-containing protein [Thermoanaerobaculia bacterium]|nr:TIR domain-containing protein [Thermoanaerobaculia bacterium]